MIGSLNAPEGAAPHAHKFALGYNIKLPTGCRAAEQERSVFPTLLFPEENNRVSVVLENFIGLFFIGIDILFVPGIGQVLKVPVGQARDLRVDAQVRVADLVVPTADNRLPGFFRSAACRIVVPNS